MGTADLHFMAAQSLTEHEADTNDFHKARDQQEHPVKEEKKMRKMIIICKGRANPRRGY